MSKKDKTIWVAKAVLAKHLNVSRQVINNWASRGVIRSQYSEEIGQTLVEKIDEIPTKEYIRKEK